jgi:hypothetical protein
MAEVREKEPRRFALEYRRERRIPDFEIDIRRRRRGHFVRMAFDAHARGIADESYSFLMVEIADVMRSVPGSVHNFQFARSKQERLAPFENAQILRGNRKHLTE